LTLAPDPIAGRLLGWERVLSWSRIWGEPIDEACELRDPDVAFVQFSSGTTGTPRGAVLTSGAIAAQLCSLIDALAIDTERDRVVSWLPLSHDMGFFGTLMVPLAAGVPLRLATPRRFVASARSWFDDCVEFGATITAGSNTALEFAARAARGSARRRSLRLSA